MKSLARYRRLLEDGIAHFQDGRHWEAHESWEEAWRFPENLVPKVPDRLRLQGLIQAVAALHLIGIGREAPGRRLCTASLEKLRRADPAACDFRAPWVEIPGIEKVLEAIEQAQGSAEVTRLRALLRQP